MRQIGQYEIQEELGRGGFGVVYKAYDPYMDEMVAIKTMSDERLAEEGYREKFFEEARKTRRLRHDNIVRVDVLAEDEGRPYMVMEFLEGQDLNGQISSSVPISLEESLRIVKDMCNGVAYAHKQELIHRDIKPHNIFMTVTGQVKVLDFGLARLVTANSKTSKLIGSPHYMAPEVWNKKADKRSDIFAIGAVFYELLTRRKAFEGDGFEQVYFNILHHILEPVEKVNPALPPELSGILLRALAKEPAERYQQVESMLEDIRVLERSLEERKPALQTEAMEAVGGLGLLIRENRELLDDADADLELIRNISPSLLDPGEKEAAGDESATVYRPPLDYLSLVYVCRDAKQAHERISVLVQRRKKFAPEVSRAVDLEKSAEWGAALEVYEQICREDPTHTRAIARREELAEKIAKQQELEQKLREIEIHIKGAQTKFNSGDWAGCEELTRKALELDEGYEEALRLLDETRRKVEEEAEKDQKNERRRQKEESVRGTRVEELYQEATELFLANDLDASLKLLDEAVEIEPKHRAVRTLRKAVLSKIRELEELTQRRQESNEVLDRAEVALKESNFGEARQQVDKAREIWPDAPRIPEILGAVKKAEDELWERQARQEKLNALIGRAQSLDQPGQESEAIAQLDGVLELEPTHREARKLRKEIEKRRQARESGERLFKLAQSRLSNDDLGGCLELLGDVFRFQPDHAEAKKLKEDVQQRIKNEEERRLAQDQCEKALDRALEALREGNTKEAREELELASSVDPHSPRIATVLEAIDKKTAQIAREKRVAELLDDARELFGGGDEEKAIFTLAQLQEIDPDNADVIELRRAIDEHRALAERVEKLCERANTRLSSNDLQGCLALVEEALRLSPEHGTAKELRERVKRQFREQKERDDRRRQSEDALTRAEEAIGAGKLEEAREAVQQAQALEPESPRIAKVIEKIDHAEASIGVQLELEAKIKDLLEKAHAYDTQGKEEDALGALDALLDLDPSHSAAHKYRREIDARRQLRERVEKLYERAEKRLTARDRPGALALLEEALTLQPEHSPAKELLESVKEQIREQQDLETKQRQCEEALTRARKAIAEEDLEQARQEVAQARVIYPASLQIDDLVAQIDRGEATRKARLDKEEKIKQLLQEAIALEEESREEEALDKLEGLLELDPGNVAARQRKDDIGKNRQLRERIKTLYDRAQARFSSRDYSGSSALLEEVLTLEPEHPAARQLLEQVRQEVQKEQELETKRRECDEALDRAEEAIAAEDVTRARQEIESARRSYPESARIADVLERAEQKEAAIQSRIQREERIRCLLDESRTADEAGSEDDAMATLEELLSLDPGHKTGLELKSEMDRRKQTRLQVQRLFKRAEERFSSNDVSACLALLEEVFSLQPEHQGATELRESVQQRTKEQAKLDEEIHASNEALVRARKALAAQQFDHARQEVEIGRGHYSGAPWVPEMLESIDRAQRDVQSRTEQQTRINELLSKALSLNASGEEDIALVQIQELLALESAHVDALKLKREIEGRQESRRQEARALRDRIAATYRKAEAAETAGKLVRAGELARSVLSEDSQNVQALDLLERIEAELGKRKEAEEGKRDRIARLMSAVKRAIPDKRFPEAIQALDEILRLEPDDPEVLELRRQTQSQYEVIRERDKRVAEGEREKKSGLELLREKKYAEGLAALRRSEEFLGEDPLVTSRIVEAERAIELEIERKDLQRAISEARELLASGDYASARTRALRALEVSPRDARAAEVLRSIERAQENEKRRAKVAALLIQSRLALSEQNYEEGSALVRELLMIDPENDEATGLLRTLEQALEDRGKRETVAALLAQSQHAFNEQRFDEAGTQIREALFLDPQNDEAKALRNRIDKTREERSKKETIDTLLVQSEQALLSGEFGEASIRAREVFLHDADNQEANDLLERIGKAQEDRRRREEASGFLAQCREARAKQEFEEAVGFAEEALRVDPDNQEAKSLIKAIEKDITGRERPYNKWVAAGLAVISVVVVGLALVTFWPGTGELLISSQPLGAAVLLNDESIGTTDEDGLPLTDLEPGTYKIVAQKEGYRDFEEEITVTKGRNPDKKITLVYALSRIQVVTDQEGAQIFLDGEYTGVETGSDGKAEVFDIDPGSHGVLISKAGFEEWKDNAVSFSAGQTTSLPVGALRPLKIPRDSAWLRITTVPTDARITVDGGGRRTTGLSIGGSFTAKELGPGEVSVVVESDGYEPKRRTIALLAGKEIPASFVLDAKPALLLLRTNPAVSGASVQLNGNEVGKTSGDGTWRADLGHGAVTLQIMATDHVPETRMVDLRPGERKALDISLTPMAVAPTTTALSISSQPSVASVYLDDNPVPVGQTPLTSYEIEPGDHTISIRKEAYRPFTKEYTMAVGTMVIPEVILEKAHGELQITTEPLGAVALVADKEYYINASTTIELPPGTHNIRISKNNYRPQEVVVELSDGEQTAISPKLERLVPITRNYADDFSTLAKWENNSKWSTDGKKLTAQGPGLLLSKGVFKDFTQKVSLALANSTSASLIVRAKDEQNYYLIRVNGNDYSDSRRRGYIEFYVFTDGVPREVNAERLPIETKKMKEPFNLIIKASGNQFSVKASGPILSGTRDVEKNLGSFTDPDNLYPEGRIGFHVGGNEEFHIYSLVTF